MKNLFYRILRLIKRFIIAVTFRDQRRDSINKMNREQLKNKSFTIISSNCNGGVMCHELGVRFNSQFVNLWMYPKHFMQYISNLDYYNSIDEIEFLPHEESGHDYPVGIIDGMKIFFVHYSSDEEALEKWNSRKKRINKDNVFVMMSEQNKCTIEDLEQFDKLPYKNKIVFTKRPYDDINSAFYIRGFEKKKELGTALAFRNVFSSKRYYDQFPYVDWLNGELLMGQDEK